MKRSKKIKRVNKNIPNKKMRRKRSSTTDKTRLLLPKFPTDEELKKQYEEYQKEKAEVDKYSLWWLKRNLKPWWKDFVHEYVRNGWKKSHAYKVARNLPNVDTTQACVAANRLLKDPRIKAYLNHVKEDYEVLCGISKAKQIHQYMKIGYASFMLLKKDWYNLEDWEMLKKENPWILDVIESEEIVERDTEFGTVRNVKIRLPARVPALQQIDKLMGYLEAQKIDIDTENSIKLGTGSVDVIRKAFNLDMEED